MNRTPGLPAQNQRDRSPGTTLRWHWPEAVSSDWESGFMGPGSAFELVEEDVLGQRLPVFAQRPPHLRATLEQAAERYGDQTYLVFVGTGESLTFAQVRDRVAALCPVLVEHGIGQGDRVAIASANCAAYALLGYATAALGAIIVGLNGWWTGPELDYGLELTTPKLVAGDAKRLERLAGTVSPWASRTVPFETLLARLADGRAASDLPLPLPEVTLAEDDPVMILFTSGTTGRPKGAVLSHRNLGHMALSSALGMALAALTPPEQPVSTRQPASIHVSPFFHISGVVPLFITSPMFGMKLVFPPGGRWDELTQLRLSQEHGITSWSGVPTQLRRLLEHPELDSFDLGSLRTIGVGGAMLAAELIRHINKKLPTVRVTNGYGMTESTGNGTRAVGDLLLAHSGSVGPAEPGIEVQVRDIDGTKVMPDGEIGEIHMRGASIFLGYWEDKEATAVALDAERWYRSGDYGRVEDGVLCLESRMRDLIIRAGENIYPIEIENRLVEHPDIEEAAVIGVDHQVLGQEVKAVLVTRANSTVTADAVREWVRMTLAPFKVPTHVEFRSELPLTASGKPMKHLLEEEARQR